MSASDPLYQPFDGYSTVQQYPLGHVLEDLSVTPTKRYMYVQAGQSLTNSAFAANEACSLKSASTFEVTNDVSTGLDATNPFAMGRANSACPQSTSTVTYYFWVQIGGIATLKTDGGDDIAKGDAVTVDETVDGAVDRLTTAGNVTSANSKSILGWALADDAANTVSVLLIAPAFIR